MTVTFLPRFKKLYRLQLRCRTATVAPLAVPPVGAPGRPSSGSNGAPRLPPLGPRPGAAAGPDGLAAATGKLAATLPAPPAVCCPLSADATFPALLLTDAFIEGLPKQVVWDMLSARALNDELQSQVTSTELELNKVGV